MQVDVRGELRQCQASMFHVKKVKTHPAEDENGQG